jgi:ribonuclease D
MDNQYIKTITKEEINNLPSAHFKGKITIIDNMEKLEEAIPLLDKESYWGFDTETKPSFKKGKKNKVSLLQLSNSSQAFLFRLNKIGLPQQIANILSKPNILKVGVAIRDDIITLNKLTKFTPEEFIDLQQYAEKSGIVDKSLKKLSAIVLGIKISKSQQTSNWEVEELTSQQKIYAATDAWVCHEIYMKLNK